MVSNPKLTVAAGAAALIMLVSACERNEAVLVDDGGTSQSASTDSDGTPALFAVGDRVALGDWEFVVHGVTDPFDNGPAFGEPDVGHRWLAVDVEIYNMGVEPRDPLPLLCFDVQDSLNRSYDQKIFAETSVGRPDGEIAPGQSRRGTVVWELLDDADELRMNVKCDIFSQGSATFQLS